MAAIQGGPAAFAGKGGKPSADRILTPVRIRSLRAFLALATLVLLVPAAAVAQEERPQVLAAHLDNDINPVTQDFLENAIDRAEDEELDAVVVVLDTPGGLASSMRGIVKRFLASPVPVVVYVAPPGSSADSAGAVITMAADVAAMAPQTNIGSSTPISLERRGHLGGPAAEDRQRRGRLHRASSRASTTATSPAARKMVTEAANYGAREAQAIGLVDVVAPTLPALLSEIDGMKTVPKGLVLHTAGAEIENVEMSFWERARDLLVDPNLIALMLSIGLLGIVVELWNPGLIFPGTVGAISLILAMYGLQVLPVSLAGLLLMILAAAFFVAEAFVPTHGALTVAGAVTFVLGALMLFDPAGEAYQVSLPVALGIAGTLTLLLGVAFSRVWRVARQPPAVGTEGLVGGEGVVRRDGLVFLNGELWRAQAADGAPLVPESTCASSRSRRISGSS